MENKWLPWLRPALFCLVFFLGPSFWLGSRATLARQPRHFGSVAEPRSGKKGRPTPPANSSRETLHANDTRQCRSVFLFVRWLVFVLFFCILFSFSGAATATNSVTRPLPAGRQQQQQQQQRHRPINTDAVCDRVTLRDDSVNGGGVYFRSL